MQSPWKVILAFLGIFVAGSVFGGFFALRIEQELEERNSARISPRSGPPLSIQILRRLGEQLDLTDDQREKIRPKVLHAEELLSHLRQTQLEQTDEILRRVQADFRAELTVEQRARLDRLEENQREVMRKERALRQQGQGRPPLGPRGEPGFDPGERPGLPPAGGAGVEVPPPAAPVPGSERRSPGSG